jgi:signal transduction histidine kinase
LSKLKSATISLGKGNLDVKADVNSRDEFGELAETFNKMAEDLKKSRDKIEDYNRILERIIDQKDEFIGQLGHDLKNPMQPLVGLLPILIEKEKDPDNKEMLEVMHANVEYMQDLIFDTLKLAKLRSDNIDFNYEKIALRELSDKVVKTQKTMLSEKNIEIINKIKKDTIVTADKLRLSEVFKNLINNSVKYTKETGGTITLNAEKENHEQVKISIKDTGIGMTEEQLRKVFDEFYKADRQTSDYYSTGLGLAICKRIVEKHGGSIWVESPGPGKGSTFYFTIKTESKNN